MSNSPEGLPPPPHNMPPNQQVEQAFMEENKLHPVAHYSRKLQPAELNYEIYDKEMLAIVAAFKIWRPYLEGSKDILVYSDHKNLEYFTISKVLNHRPACWSGFLAHLDFKITYRPGTTMGKLMP
jgi:hypothetical protein